MSIFSKPKIDDASITYERFELESDPPFPDPVERFAPEPPRIAEPPREGPPPLLVPPGGSVEGNIRSGGLVRIEGTLRGDVHAPVVEVAAHGRIEGCIYARLVSIQGSFHGTAVAEEIELLRTATVDAELTYAEISIERGARVRGLHRQRETEAETTAAAAKQASAELTAEAELALLDLAEVAGAAARASADLAGGGMAGLMELDAELRAELRAAKAGASPAG